MEESNDLCLNDLWTEAEWQRAYHEVTYWHDTGRCFPDCPFCADCGNGHKPPRAPAIKKSTKPQKPKEYTPNLSPKKKPVKPKQRKNAPLALTIKEQLAARRG